MKNSVKKSVKKSVKNSVKEGREEQREMNRERSGRARRFTPPFTPFFTVSLHDVFTHGLTPVSPPTPNAPLDSSPGRALTAPKPGERIRAYAGLPS